MQSEIDETLSVYEDAFKLLDKIHINMSEFSDRKQKHIQLIINEIYSADHDGRRDR